MKKSELIALGVVAIECIIIGIFEHALKGRVDKILDESGAKSFSEYFDKKRREHRGEEA